MDIARTDLGQLTDIAAVGTLLSVNGLTVVDIGCGPAKCRANFAR